MASSAAIIASIYLFFIVSRTAKRLKIGFLWVAMGVSIGLALHSLAEFLESASIIDTELLIKIMSPLVLIGSILVLVGSIILYQTIRSVGDKKKA